MLCNKWFTRTVYVTVGRSGTQAHSQVQANNWHEIFDDLADEPSYLAVEVEDDHLSVKAFKQSGSQIDALGIGKPN